MPRLQGRRQRIGRLVLSVLDPRARASAARGARAVSEIVLDPLVELAKRINAEHAAAQEHSGKAITHALNVGELLLRSKEQCKHGQWLPWLRTHVSFSERTAQGYMRLASRRDIRSAVADMSVRKALECLATPRNHSFEDDLAAWGAAHPPRKPVSDWTIDDAIACFERIRAFDEIMHRYNICEGDDCCLVCAPGRVSVA
jgi:hypothetical protein